MKRQLGWPALSVLTLSACSDARLIDTSTEGQSRLRVSPDAFIGDVPCVRDATGALRRYVVQLQQLDGLRAADSGVEPINTPPVPCDQSVSFPVVPNRFYAAEILGFDTEISPDDFGTIVPRWTARCGRGAASDAGPAPFAPILAIRGLTVPLRNCTQFGAPAGASSQLVVNVEAALGDLSCGNQPGQVGLVEGVLEGVRRTVRCGDALIFPIAVPGRFHDVDLAGYELLTDAGIAAPPDLGPPGPELTDSGVSDAGPSDAATPAAGFDASIAPSSAFDASVADAALDGGEPPLLTPDGPPQWRTRCVGRSLPAASRVAFCAPFSRLP